MSVEFIVLSISAPADIQAVSIAFRNPATNHSRHGLCSVVEATSCPGTTRQTMMSTCNVSANQSRAKVRNLFEHPHAYRVWSIVGPPFQASIEEQQRWIEGALAEMPADTSRTDLIVNAALSRFISVHGEEFASV